MIREWRKWLSTEHSPAGGGTPGYETRDAHPASLVKFAIGLALTLVVAWAGMWWLLGYLGQSQEEGPAAAPFRALHERQLPPLPRIQVNPVRELNEVSEEQSDKIDHYDWVDRNHGVVRIPIDEAMKLILERGGLPARPGGGTSGTRRSQRPAKAKTRTGEGAQ